MNHIETLQWFEKFYNKNKKMVDIIVKNDRNKMIEYFIPDVWSGIVGEYKEIKVYRIKGFTKFNWDELMISGVTLELASIKGKPHLCYCYSNYYPEIRFMGEKQYLSEKSLKRLKEVFTRLIINLEYYKKYAKMEG